MRIATSANHCPQHRWELVLPKILDNLSMRLCRYKCAEWSLEDSGVWNSSVRKAGIVMEQ